MTSESTASTHPDLRAAAALVADLVRTIDDDQLGSPTPCPGTTVGAMLDHLAGLSLAFTAAARQERVPGGDQPPTADGSRLEPGFRSAIPASLAALAEAWQEQSAWSGMTRVGGVDLPGEVAGLVALDEVVVHGWDLAVATGQPYEPPSAALEGALAFVASSVADNPSGTPGLFAAPVPVPDDAPLLHRLIGLTGRDPGWRPADSSAETHQR